MSLSHVCQVYPLWTSKACFLVFFFAIVVNHAHGDPKSHWQPPSRIVGSCGRAAGSDLIGCPHCRRGYLRAKMLWSHEVQAREQKQAFPSVIPGAFHSQRLQVLPWLTAAESCNSRPAVIHQNRCWPAGQASYRNKNTSFHWGARSLASKETAEESQVTAPGDSVCGIQASPALRSRTGDICCPCDASQKRWLAMAARWASGRGQEMEEKACTTT